MSDIAQRLILAPVSPGAGHRVALGTRVAPATSECYTDKHELCWWVVIKAGDLIHINVPQAFLKSSNFFRLMFEAPRRCGAAGPLKQDR